MARSRRPMVSTLGLTRSNGSVSQAGNSVDLVLAEEGPQVVGQALGVGLVGTATTSGWRPVSPARPAMAKARAGSATASTADDTPANPASPGWRRRRGGRSCRVTRRGYRRVRPYSGGCRGRFVS